MARGRLKGAELVVAAALEQDARRPLAAVAKRHRRSQQQLNATLQAMTGKTLIHSLYALIDYSKLDVLCFRVYFSVSYASDERIQALLARLRAEPHTAFVATCGGRYDLACTFFAENPSRFNKTLRALMADYPEQLQNYTALTTVVNRYFGRKYLAKGLPEELIFGGDRKPAVVDALDHRILAAVAQDARRSALSIAGETGVAAKTVINRLKGLAERQVILGYRQHLDVERLGGLFALLTISYHNVSSDVENRLVTFLQAHPRVVWLTKTFGAWDIEIAVEAASEEDLRRVELELRRGFPTIIQSLERIPVYKVHKLSLYPAFLAETIYAGAPRRTHG